jgi:hypothetical protein
VILQIADNEDALVVSNDSYREFQGSYPWIRSGNRIIGATLIAGRWVFTPRRPPANTAA